ncbi:hypothetical protein CBM2606_A110105 [Cupriavidus taiwanensis]|nr:hypothetical protein CBM2606_A110105 [Cupriavidus taiwanensis]
MARGRAPSLQAVRGRRHRGEGAPARARARPAIPSEPGRAPRRRCPDARRTTGRGQDEERQ